MENLTALDYVMIGIALSLFGFMLAYWVTSDPEAKRINTVYSHEKGDK